MKNYVDHGKVEKVKPVFEKKELTTTHYTLGDDKLNYATTNKTLHDTKHDK